MQIYPIETDSETKSWVAIDQIANYPKTGNKVGSSACRQLLNQLQRHLNLVGQLMESEFPYYFTLGSQVWHVSFSHSRKHIAVLISAYRNIGIDIEDTTISQNVAKRFFSSNELDWVTHQPMHIQTSLCGLFWRLKECHIKTHQCADEQLFKALKKDMLEEWGQNNLYQLIQTNKSVLASSPINFIIKRNQVLGHFNELPCSFVIIKN